MLPLTGQIVPFLNSPCYHGNNNRQTACQAKTWPKTFYSTSITMYLHNIELGKKWQAVIICGISWMQIERSSLKEVCAIWIYCCASLSHLWISFPLKNCEVSFVWLRGFSSCLACVNSVEAVAQIQAVCITGLLREAVWNKILIWSRRSLFFKVIKQDGQIWMTEMGRKYYKYAFHYIWKNLIQGK